MTTRLDFKRFDDFGNGNDIQNAVIQASNDGIIRVSKYIGENAGYKVKRLNGELIEFNGAEGVICNL